MCLNAGGLAQLDPISLSTPFLQLTFSTSSSLTPNKGGTGETEKGATNDDNAFHCIFDAEAKAKYDQGRPQDFCSGGASVVILLVGSRSLKYPLLSIW